MIDTNFLKDLGIGKSNSGTCDGVNWFCLDSTERHILSPVDGNLIASVFETDEKSYEKLIGTVCPYGINYKDNYAWFKSKCKLAN